MRADELHPALQVWGVQLAKAHAKPGADLEKIEAEQGLYTRAVAEAYLAHAFRTPPRGPRRANTSEVSRG